MDQYKTNASPESEPPKMQGVSAQKIIWPVSTAPKLLAMAALPDMQFFPENFILNLFFFLPLDIMQTMPWVLSQYWTSAS